MKVYIISFICALFLTFILGLIFIPLLRKLKLGQPILKYVEEHKDKGGTPTMGGLFFILSSTLIYGIFSGFSGKLAIVSLTIGLAFMVVGFTDDFIKVKFHHNEGLKPYQKIIFQLLIAVFAGIFACKNGLTVMYVPFANKSIDLGFATVFVVAIIFIAITNAVNLTDGLDGLAGSVSFIYLLFTAILILLELNLYKSKYILPKEYQNLVLLCCSLMGGICGFLLFNVSKAKIFMGDTGSLSLGGFLGAICIFSSNTLYIPILGIMFVVSCISVIIQVVHYKRTKRRVFLMAPLHHHFEHKGYSETQITYFYTVITVIFGLISVLPLV